jgi:hypothetical protein
MGWHCGKLSSRQALRKHRAPENFAKQGGEVANESADGTFLSHEKYYYTEE